MLDDPEGLSLQELVRDLTQAEIEELVDSLPPALALVLADELGAMTDSRNTPETPIGQAVPMGLKFRSRPHLEYMSKVLSEAVRDVENGKNRKIIIEMPPRTGKTTLGTLLTPAWIMAGHPSWSQALTSHDGGLASSWGRQIRRWVESGALGDHVALSRDAGAVGSWETTEGGKLLSISIRESFTGRGAKVLIIDDPHKDFVDAHSATMRDNVWNWWLSVAQTRLEPPSLVLVIMCMTGDTPVLRPDGTETPLRAIRPGDEIATYENGHLTTSRVVNWASQGPDDIFEIRMESGRTVRANARHPFLTIDENGTETWLRTDQLEPGSKVLSVSVSEPLPITWSVTPDRVVSVTPAGREEVFDLQVERTENFIANGLVSHNTRWHEDDLVGRLLSPDYEGDPSEWEVIRLPAIADSEDDLLGRAVGEPLLSPLLEENQEEALERWREVRHSVGEYVWSAMYQQRPAPASGSIFDMDRVRYWTTDPDRVTPDGQVTLLPEVALREGAAQWVDSWDMTFKGSGSNGDYVVGQRWARLGAERYLIAQQRGRWSFTESLERVLAWGDGQGPYGHLVHQRVVEDKANGPAIIDALKERVTGLRPHTPQGSKESRARAVTPEWEAGQVILPHPSEPGCAWVRDLLAELRNFPLDAHDDQVDSLTQGLLYLRSTGVGHVTIPGASGRSFTRGVGVGPRATLGGLAPRQRRLPGR